MPTIGKGVCFRLSSTINGHDMVLNNIHTIFIIQGVPSVNWYKTNCIELYLLPGDMKNVLASLWSAKRFMSYVIFTSLPAVGGTR